MISPTFKQVLRFLVMLLLQVLMFNHIHLFGFINPDIYLYALLLLPMDLPQSVLYLIGFASGFVVDLFDLTFGIHASAALLMIACRPYVIKLLNINKKKDELDVPTPATRDLKSLLTFTLILVAIHQLMVNMLEVFSFHRFGITLLSVLTNTIFTTILILCIEYIFIPVKKKKQ